jgi:hypothetical protein
MPGKISESCRAYFFLSQQHAGSVDRVDRAGRADYYVDDILGAQA